MAAFDYGNLRYHEACYKASHNSYLRQELPAISQLQWTDNAHHQYGCRGLEIDLYQSDKNWLWSVSHLPPYSGSIEDQFSSYLQQLATWSELNVDHDVITIMLDLKKTRFDDRDFPGFFDSYLRSNFPVERLFTPADLMGSHGNLVKAAVTDGWPRLNDLRNKVLFCFSGNEKRKRLYANRAPKQRLCFSDHKLGPDDDPPSLVKGSRVFFNFDLSDDDLFKDGHHEIGGGFVKTKLPKLLKFFQAHHGLVTRGYGLNASWHWNNAHKLGINNLSTDKVTGSQWAKVGDLPFMKAKA